MLISRLRSRLHEVDIRAADAFFDIDLDFTITKAGNGAFAKFDVKQTGNFLR